ncbi:basement membrane-specific heparan sulfate proteoglycan core protein isoform X6 [Frankliniella occidentalis]|uniref:Basement membrane-specific heparan sulfate proteoglycan core protein isoform X6 n=1 Tax=Frankliniella occidentalis TaxID=133901 RepID=A0A9C6U3D9_FRAOC|nr:basement membrane-specific heparan sulfate proteoglycan core protein isoform X6 [Frankliniella occidentalis]
MRLGSALRGRAALCAALVVVAVLGVAAAAVELDGDDLVFEDRHHQQHLGVVAVDSGGDHRTERHQQGPSRPSSDPPPAGPTRRRRHVQDGVEEHHVDDGGGGFLGFITKQLHRVRRQSLFPALDWLTGGSGSSTPEPITSTTVSTTAGEDEPNELSLVELREKRSTAADDEEGEELANTIGDAGDSTAELVPSTAAEGAHGVSPPLESSTPGRRTDTPVDDEDYGTSGSDGEGSADAGRPGHNTTSPHDLQPGIPRFYRITLVIVEPWHEEYADRKSSHFRDMAKALEDDINRLYEEVPGKQTVSIISIQRAEDHFDSKVTLDLGTDNYDRDLIQNTLLKQIEKYQKIGSFMAKTDSFTFRDFGARGAPVECHTSELACRSGECVPLKTRCDGNPDCADGSDEQGCAKRTSPSTFNTTTSSWAPSSTGSVDAVSGLDAKVTRGPGGQPSCRADDQVRCGDGSVYICADQKCDGKWDCPHGDDELGCPRNECAQGEFMCDITRCIPKSSVCDDKTDCVDGTDELSCPDDTEEPICDDDQYQCRDGRCIEDIRRCNKAIDCEHGDDEENCPCGPTDFTCENGGCIESHKRCDGVMDCLRDDSDERNCPSQSHQCREDEKSCADGTCIPSHAWCNKAFDCPDKSDERNCPCKPGDFICRSGGVCISANLRCDGTVHCQDKSDEESCPESKIGCLKEEFQCRDHSCILLLHRCDRKIDCADGSDEDDCDKFCGSDQFKCSDGRCLSLSQRCNGLYECPEGEDERNCPKQCAYHEFFCNNGQCVDQAKRCNGYPDCYDRSDEDGCGDIVAPCPASDFSCSDGYCVSMAKKCDGVPDCADGDDERNCSISHGSGSGITDPPQCQPDQFRCEDGGQCIRQIYRCDRIRDCLDGSDEKSCATCAPNEITCTNGQCLDGERTCDGTIDCPDGSDEDGCEPTCGGNEFTCSDRSCIDLRRKCDRIPDCRDGSDEIGCDCRPGEFRCGSGECIPNVYQCDGRPHCQDGSDENSCVDQSPSTAAPPRSCPYGQFSCHSNGLCISQSAVCDGRSDCIDSSDEANCDWRPCLQGEFRCENGPCIPEQQRCDGKRDCPHDISDELDCSRRPGNPPSSPADLNLKTYPEDQIIKERREVVFQCRDEGPLRARVKWSRANNLPLPPGSQDRNGRLEMPNIQLEHSGNYICEAVGYPENIPGSRLTVLLRVEQYIVPTTRPPQVCGAHEATCSSGECIAKSQVCDGNYDCSDQSDEMRCNPDGCEPNEFQCDNKKCVMKTWRCDSDDDCGDGSDERNCATNPPDSKCRYHEFECRSGDQCIPKSFHCDGEVDCQDGSDESGCFAVQIAEGPKRMEVLQVGETMILTCRAVGVPTPVVVWRLNWGHVPAKCTSTSERGIGTLTCPNVQESDQGAYSCEALNMRGREFAVPDTILVVTSPNKTVCAPGSFNSDARHPGECISCFCFGVATRCKSANLYTYQLPPPIDSTELSSVRVDLYAKTVEVLTGPIYNLPSVRNLGRNSLQIYSSTIERDGFRLGDNVYPYFALHDNFHGNQLRTYGGYLKYSVKYEGNGRPVDIPDVILSGNGYILVHNASASSSPGQEIERSIRFFHGEWYRRLSSTRGSTSDRDILASREEIMMALADVNGLLIKTRYIDGPLLDTSLTNIQIDSAGIRNVGQGKASFVEECQCPAGYSGLSCEVCSADHHRREHGPWLGMCMPEERPCPPGYYKNSSGSGQCERCPCPHTNPSNQFAHTCHLDTDGQVTCDCPQGYEGRRCQKCASGYQGNPFIPGDICRPGYCNAAGSLSSSLDPSTGTCVCKANVTGPYCDKCKASTFHLDTKNQFGCVDCFCMGVSRQCSSSNWFRQQVVAQFTRDTQDFKIVEALKQDEPITSGIRLNPNSRELIYQDFSRRSSDVHNVHYWKLPARFLGNKITSYGGDLKYVIRYVPTPGGQSSRNSAPDVELISSNAIRLLYFGHEQLEANRPQNISVPLYEQFWQRQDGQKVDRAHMLMALSTLEDVLIKATYTTSTLEAALLSVSLDIAEERNTGQERALSVEQCVCPPGHQGLSCEECSTGYTRSDGLYLGICVPCNCNGHSSECDPVTGVCRDCRGSTTGDQCEQCLPGFEGDAYRGDCRPRHGPACYCDPRGSLSSECNSDGSCTCKTNVEGHSCDYCRPGTFDLSPNNSEGCLSCFCMGVTDQCQSSTLHRTQIPMQVLGNNHGFNLTDNDRSPVVFSGFKVDWAKNEISYEFVSPPKETYFWSLPNSFTGNKVASYGGNLVFTQKYSAEYGAQPTHDTDVVLFGNGISVYWSNLNRSEPNVTKVVTIPLQESAGWKRLDINGPRSASRRDLLTILSSLETILIRSSHSDRTYAIYLSDVSMDTAVSMLTGEGIVTHIESCRCPPGYGGLSCESCATGFYRNTSDLSASVLGSCIQCPCNGNEESCSIASDFRVTCYCKPGYSGRQCDNSGSQDGVRVELTPLTVRQQVGALVHFTCTYYGSEPLGIEFEEIRRLKPNSHIANVKSVSGNIRHMGPAPLFDLSRKLKMSDEQAFDVTITADLRAVKCVIKNSDGLDVAMVMSHIMTKDYPVSPSPEIFNQPPSIHIAIAEPTIKIVEVGGTVRFSCTARPLTNKGPVRIYWSKEGGNLVRDRSTDDGEGRLVIISAVVSDSGTYICTATDGSSYVTERATLTVGGSEPSAPEVHISPRYLEVQEGEPVAFNCHTTGTPLPSLQWTGGPNNPQASFRDGVFRIPAAQRSDEAEYHCIATNPLGTISERTILYVREGVSRPPSMITDPHSRLSISPPDYSGQAGDTVRLTCVPGYNDYYSIDWSKVGSNALPSTANQQDRVLTIFDANPADSGIYLCRVTSRATGLAEEIQARVSISSNRGPPTARIEPERQTVSQGTTAELRCLTSVEPSSIRWSKAGEPDMGSNVQELGNILKINNALVRNRGVYVCTVQNDGGTSQASTILEVERREPPAIEIYPSQRQTVVVGGSALLQCRITSGIPSPAIIWRRSDSLALSPNVEELQNGVLRFNRVTTADAGDYTCEAQNEVGTTNATASLEIDSMPTITITPSSPITISTGQPVRLECRAHGEPSPTVIWSRNRPGYAYYEPTNLTAESSQIAVYEITRASKADEGSYSCTARNKAGLAEDRVQLIVEESNDVLDRYPERGDITGEDPGSYGNREPFVVNVHGNAELRCDFRHNSSNTFIKWMRSGGELPASHTLSQGSLHLSDVKKEDAGLYICEGYEDNRLLFQAPARLVVNGPPQIQLHPQHQVVRPGESARVQCRVIDTERHTIMWTIPGRENLGSSALPSNANDHDGILEFSRIGPQDSGRYLCRARNEYGEADAVAEVLVQDQQPASLVRAVDHEQIVHEGSNARLLCSSSPGTLITWTHEGRALPENAVQEAGTLTIYQVKQADAGRYECQASSDADVGSDYVNLRVEVPADYCAIQCYVRGNQQCIPSDRLCNGVADCEDGSDELGCPTNRSPREIGMSGFGEADKIELQIYPNKDLIRNGDNVEIRCGVLGGSAVPVTWTKIGSQLANNVRVINDTLSITSVRPSNEGTYRCNARTSGGMLSEDYTLIIEATPINLIEPPPVETQTAAYGRTVEMACRTNLNPPVKYMWSKQGGELPRDARGQMESTLTIVDVRAQDAGFYTCTAQNEEKKMDIRTVLVVTGVVPYFAQAPNSFMALPTLIAYMTFNISISFKPERSDGLILYNGQQSGGSGDFVSLGLNGGFVEFRFDVGSGPAVIRSARPVSLGHWHTVKLIRNRRDGEMYVDEAGPHTGIAPGRFQGLDLSEPLYLGGVPDFKAIHRLTGHSQGFVGCISRLVVGNVEHELVRDATEILGVTTCETCAGNTCKHKGVCQEAPTSVGYTCMCPAGFSGDDCSKTGQSCYPGACGAGRCVNLPLGGMQCLCPMGKIGRNCEYDVAIQDPAFSNGAYIAYPTPKTPKKLKMTLRINPADVKDALVMYSAQNDDGSGDFAALSIRDRHFEFRFDAGTGTSVLRSKRELHRGEWFVVSLSRDTGVARLSVDGEPPVTQRLHGSPKPLNLQTPLYIGGYDTQKIKLAPGMNVDQGFTGCISAVDVASLSLELIGSVVDSANVEDCSTKHGVRGGRGGVADPCHFAPCQNGAACNAIGALQYTCSCLEGFSGHDCEVESDMCLILHPCLNGGKCTGSLSSFKCHCPIGFGGATCNESVIFSSQVSFGGDGWLELNRDFLPHKSNSEDEVISIRFTTNDTNSLVLWHGQSPDDDGQNQDYLSLSIINGKLEWSYELGSGPAHIRLDSVNVNDGLPHTVVLRRRAEEGSIELDGQYSARGHSNGNLTQLNTNGNIYIGGVPNADLMTGNTHSNGFSGCIHAVQIQNSKVLNLFEEALQGSNILNCPKSDVPPHNRFKWTPSSLVYTDSAQIFDIEQDIMTTSQPLPVITDTVTDIQDISHRIHDPYESNEKPVDTIQILSTDKSFQETSNINSINKDNNILKNNHDPFLRSSDNSHPIFDPPFNDLDTAKRKKTTMKPPTHKSSCQSLHSLCISSIIIIILFSMKASSPYWR